MYDSDKGIPQILSMAQELQKVREYKLSREMYLKFFRDYPRHQMRFKALFEVADNWYYEGEYKEACAGYNAFLRYCAEQDDLTGEEMGWISAYTQLAKSRLSSIRDTCEPCKRDFFR